MSKPKLPSRPSDSWEGGFVLDKTHDVKAIDARGGMVVAGGDAHYLLKPGDQTWKVRPPAEDIGPMHAVAAEPRGARRYAVATDTTLALFVKTKEGDQILRITRDGPGAGVMALAWGGTKGPCALYVLNGDRSLMRMRPDLSDLEELEISEVEAIASDDNGVVALVTRNDDEPLVLVSRDGATFSFRKIGEPIDEDASVDLAVADDAVALVIDQKYVLLSRGVDQPFVRVEALASPEGSMWKTGPIAFQGATSDAALLCSRWENERVRIMRVDDTGAAMAIAELEGDETHDPPEIDAISWDASRHTLWAASPYVGIFRSVAPTAKGKKKPLLS